MPMWQLFGTSDRNAQAEWQWRLAKPISLILLAVGTLYRRKRVDLS